jgi:hypothetical protein
MTTRHTIITIPLPPRVTVEGIYADMLEYLISQTQGFFEEKEFGGGREIWINCLDRTPFTLLSVTPAVGALRNSLCFVGL